MNLSPPVAPDLRIPARLDEWERRRKQIRSTLIQLLGELPAAVTPEVEILSRERREGCTCEYFRFHNGDPLGGPGAVVTGFLLIPDNLAAPAPAIHYYHWHGGDYHLGKDQIWSVNSRGSSAARELTSRGYVVLAIDACAFGERTGEGRYNPALRGSLDEISLTKLNLWYGRTIWGMRLRDERLALDYLCTRPEVDSSRIGAMGISMGSTRTWWCMALDERIRVGVGVACLTRYQDLIAYGNLGAHGIYYFVPGMLRHFDSEAVVSLCAPRPLLFLTGDQDAGSPPDGISTIDAAVEKVYALYGAPEKYRSIVYPGVGHAWTPTMWEETIAWIDRWLK